MADNLRLAERVAFAYNGDTRFGTITMVEQQRPYAQVVLDADHSVWRLPLWCLSRVHTPRTITVDVSIDPLKAEGDEYDLVLGDVREAMQSISLPGVRIEVKG
jgi:hypothetical protein